MIVVCSISALKAKYPGQAGADVRTAVEALGPVIDASGLDAPKIRDLVDQQDSTRRQPACLIGGYDLVPSFRLANPSLHAAKETDEDVPTDAPYGARPHSDAEHYLPTRAVARIPDSGVADANGFIALLQRAAQAPTLPTPTGTFQQTAAEFAGSARLVDGAIPGLSPVRLSPPDPAGTPTLPQLVSGSGRVHILLHGSDKAPGRSTLWGRAPGSSHFLPTAKAGDLANSALGGAIVSFSSCYSAMLDALPGDAPRTPGDQVALACLAAGAKVVFGATRANWIDITLPFDSFGSALIAHVWSQLRKGEHAAEALRLAKWEYARIALAADPWARPYVLKTLLQAQCYGHPMATL
jgi:hypothetical protein